MHLIYKRIGLQPELLTIRHTRYLLEYISDLLQSRLLIENKNRVALLSQRDNPVLNFSTYYGDVVVCQYLNNTYLGLPIGTAYKMLRAFRIYD